MTLPEPISEGALAFFQKLLGPVGEASEILSDKIRLYRWKSSLKTLRRAREIAAENDLPVNEVPLKFLIPFMEKSSLEEEDGDLTERWATLLAQSSADPSRVRPIFVEILSRLSVLEVRLLDELISKEHVADILKIAKNKRADESPIAIACTTINTSGALAIREMILGLLGEVCSLGPPFDQEWHQIMRKMSFEFVSAVRPGIVPEIVSIVYRGGTECEKFVGLWAADDHRIEKATSYDVLVSCGLVSRQSMVFDNALLTGSISVILPTPLAVEFVMACRGDGLIKTSGG